MIRPGGGRAAGFKGLPAPIWVKYRCLQAVRIIMLKGKKVLLGITGGIAAYKCCELIRLLRKSGAEVQAMVTRHALDFVTLTVLKALTSNEPLWDGDSGRLPIEHIRAAEWADLILVAPATGNFLAKVRAGIADDLLSTTVLAGWQKLAVAPAMNSQMYLNPATQENIGVIRSRGIRVWGPASGDLACGTSGEGRMLEPKELLDLIDDALAPRLTEKSPRCVITAGPTVEMLDPVRMLTNRSSGKMGFALARAARAAGLRTTVISGPVSLPTPAGVERINVQSAAEMRDQVLSLLPETDIFIGCAAVADFRPATVSPQKIKKVKGTDELTLTLVKNPDIIAEVARSEQRPFTAGFAAETENLEAYAKRKLTEKNLDIIAANDVSRKDSGFDSDKNSITLYDREGGKTELGSGDKQELAERMVREILRLSGITEHRSWC